jgi:CRP-like cAMP-binding protein
LNQAYIVKNKCVEGIFDVANYLQSDVISKFFIKGQPVTFSASEVILGNEDLPNGVYYISTGYVKVYSISDAGDEYLHLIYGPGEIFPLVWVYLGVATRLIFYEAMSDVLTWRVARSVFTDKMKTDLQFCYEAGLQLARQFKIYTDRVDNLEYKKASERIAYRLLFLVSRFGREEGGNTIIDPPITHEVFANSINLARESVSRELEKLTEQNIIARINQHIIVIDMQALENKISHRISFNI